MLAFTRRYASHTSCFEITNDLPDDFSLFTQFLPENVRLTKRTNHGCPSPFAPLPLQKFRHYYELVRQRTHATVLNLSQFLPA